jgi:uncharacterized protein YqjF (DUF2071 family)
MLAIILSTIAGLHSAGGVIAALGAASGFLPLLGPLRAHWKLFVIGGAGLIAFGLLFAWHISKVREAREGERLICTAEKKQSREDADDIDRQANDQAVADHLAELEAERIRTLAAEAQTQEYQNEIEALPAQIRACRAATPSDVRRLLQ